MLFAMPGCILSPRCLYMYMMDAHARAATTANGLLAGGIGRGLAAELSSGGRGCTKGENGYLGGVAVVEYSRGSIDTITRETTYSTICSLICFRISVEYMRSCMGVRTYRSRLAKHPPAAETARDERVEVALLPTIELALHEQHDLVKRHKLGEIQCVCSCRP